MSIESEVFKRKLINFKRLEDYGFKKEKNVYKYSKIFMDSFKADILINEKEFVNGKIYDLSVDEEYINFRIESQKGEFVDRVRNEYKNILNDIAVNCCDKVYFISNQANRISKLIINKYKDYPDFLWESSPGFGVFRNKNNKKWYALIANIDRSKIECNKSGEIEILNIKLDCDKIVNLLKSKGFYKAYHMNKKNWITIILDDTLSDEAIFEYVKESYEYTLKKERYH